MAKGLKEHAGRADEIQNSLGSRLSSFGVRSGPLQDAISQVDPAKVVALIGTLLAGLAAAVSSLVFLFCLMLFLSVEASGIERRLAAVATDRPDLAVALRSFAKGTRSYLLVTTV